MKDKSKLYNGREGYGYRPIPPPPPEPRLYNGQGVRLNRPPTVEYRSKMEPMSVRAFMAIHFCAFCIGFGIGAHFFG